MLGGNTEAILQQKNGSVTNEIGEKVQAWKDVLHLTGWLDLSAGDSKYTYNAKLQESTHVFLCDYEPITNDQRKTDDKRMVCNGMTFDVLLIDDPMEMHQHLEIYLRFVG